MSSDIAWVVELELLPQHREAFREITAEMVQQTQQEAGALAYERFANDEENMVVLYERYRDSASAVLHLQTFNEIYGERFVQLISRKRAYVMGSPSEDLKNLLAPLNPVFLPSMDGFARFEN